MPDYNDGKWYEARHRMRGYVLTAQDGGLSDIYDLMASIGAREDDFVIREVPAPAPIVDPIRDGVYQYSDRGTVYTRVRKDGRWYITSGTGAGRWKLAVQQDDDYHFKTCSFKFVCPLFEQEMDVLSEF